MNFLITNMNYSNSFRNILCTTVFVIFIQIHYINSQNLSSEQKSQTVTLIEQAEEHNKNGNFSRAASSYYKAANIFWENELYNDAIKLFKKSLELNEKIQNKNAIQVISNNIGMIYNDLEQYENSLLFLKKSLEIKRQMNNKQEICSQLINIANTLANLKKYNESNKYVDKALEIAVEMNNLQLMRSCYGVYAENYKGLGNSEKSFEYFNMYSTINKKIQGQKEEEMLKKTNAAVAEKDATKRELKTQGEKLKKTEDSLKQEALLRKQEQMQNELLNKENALTEALLKEKEMQHKSEVQLRYFLLAGFSLMIILALVIWISYQKNKKSMIQLAKQNHEIQQKNKEITNQKKLLEETGSELEKLLDRIYEANLKVSDSIRYAVNIQKAMLPDTKKLSYFLPESFILLKPRDMVSGDFFWFKYLEPEKSNGRKFVISAVDCTGHGVPGAFMSVIGLNLLNDIIVQNITEPAKILDELNVRIIRSLKQDTTENKDGMDMTLCTINKDYSQIEFSGANNSMIYIQNEALFVAKGTKKAIGGFHERGKRSFENQILDIETTTYCYLFSDGYVDQFGGPDNKKYMTRRFKNKLLEIHKKPMTEQRKLLDEEIEAWKGKKESQLDDILVIGFKIEPKKHT